jgi:hypothetical protein
MALKHLKHTVACQPLTVFSEAFALVFRPAEGSAPLSFRTCKHNMPAVLAAAAGHAGDDSGGSC